MSALPRLLAGTAILALSACAHGGSDDDGWRPFRAGSPIISSAGTFDRQPLPSNFGSSLTIPRVTGAALVPPPLQQEDGNVWPDPEPPRTTLTDPDAVARGIPNFRPQGLSPQLRPPQPSTPDDTPQGRRGGAIIRRPDGTSAVEGAGTEGVWTYGVPGRPGVGTAFPDGRGGRILVEPGGSTVIAPR